MNDHDFCRMLLSEARKEAQAAKVTVPQGLVALASSQDSYFVESKSTRGEYVKGDCAYSAKANFITALVDAARLVCP